MSSDDELDRLKAVVIGTLKAQGVLGKIQAELRHHVFAALTAQQQLEQQLQQPQSPDSPPRSSSSSSALHSGIEGRLILDLVQEYLSFHQLHQTLSVLRLETSLSPALAASSSSSSPPPPPDRLSLSRSLHLPVSSSPHHSLLHSLYLSAQHSRPSSPLLSPRSEDRMLPLTHPSASPLSRRGEEDLTPPISPHSSPPAHDITTSLSTSSSSTAMDDAEADYAADSLSDADWAHRYNYVESVRSV
jgi:hypothetical protein